MIALQATVFVVTFSGSIAHHLARQIQLRHITSVEEKDIYLDVMEDELQRQGLPNKLTDVIRDYVDYTGVIYAALPEDEVPGHGAGSMPFQVSFAGNLLELQDYCRLLTEEKAWGPFRVRVRKLMRLSLEESIKTFMEMGLDKQGI